MPSNQEYTDQANALATELGVEIVTEGLNNSELGKLVKKLNADKVAAAPPVEEEVGETGAALMEEAAPAVELPPFSVAAGKSLTTKVGIKADGDEITLAMLPGGQATLDKFVKLGYIVKG